MAENENKPETPLEEQPIETKEGPKSPLLRKSKLVIKGYPLGLAIAAFGLLALMIVSFVCFRFGLAAGLPLGIVSAVLLGGVVLVFLYHIWTKKLEILDSLIANVSGAVVGGLALVAAIVIAAVHFSPAREDTHDGYTDLKATVIQMPEEDIMGSFSINIMGGEFEGEYEGVLLPFKEFDVYDYEYREATLDIEEKKIYTIKSVETYAAALLNDGRILPVEHRDEEVILPQNIVEDALDQIKGEIGRVEVLGEKKEFSTLGFSISWYAIPTLESHGDIGFHIAQGEWQGDYGFYLPSFNDERFYDNESTEASQYSGEVIKYTIKNGESLFDLFLPEIMSDWDGISQSGHYLENETRTKGEWAWIRRCFDIEVGQIYDEYHLKSYFTPGDPSLADQLTYTFDFRKTYAICTGIGKDYRDTLKNLVIPDAITVNGARVPVKSILSQAFAASEIEKVSIGVNVEEIGNGAFGSCTYLTSVYFAQKNQQNHAKIDTSAFIGCPNLKTVNFNNAVATIDASAFKDCTALQSLSLGDNLVSIGNSAFSGCTKLPSVVLGPKTLTVSSGAFQGCSSLSSVDLARVTKIERVAFTGCKLSAVTLPATLRELDSTAFYDAGNIVFSVEEGSPYYSTYLGFLLKETKDGYEILGSDYNVGRNLSTEPEFGYRENDRYPIVQIAPFALAKRSELRSLSFGSSLQSIGENAFREDTALEWVDLENTSITSFRSSSFANCTNLTSFHRNGEISNYINGRISSFSLYAFEGLSFGELDLSGEGKLANLQPACFAKMPNLAHVILPKDLKYVFGSILTDCPNLGMEVPYGITYKGTIEEWRAIEMKAEDWKKGIPSGAKIYFEGSSLTRAISDPAV